MPQCVLVLRAAPPQQTLHESILRVTEVHRPGLAFKYLCCPDAEFSEAEKSLREEVGEDSLAIELWHAFARSAKGMSCDLQ